MWPLCWRWWHKINLQSFCIVYHDRWRLSWNIIWGASYVSRNVHTLHRRVYYRFVTVLPLRARWHQQQQPNVKRLVWTQLLDNTCTCRGWLERNKTVIASATVVLTLASPNTRLRTADSSVCPIKIHNNQKIHRVCVIKNCKCRYQTKVPLETCYIMDFYLSLVRDALQQSR